MSYEGVIPTGKENPHKHMAAMERKKRYSKEQALNLLMLVEDEKSNYDDSGSEYSDPGDPDYDIGKELNVSRESRGLLRGEENEARALQDTRWESSDSSSDNESTTGCRGSAPSWGRARGRQGVPVTTRGRVRTRGGTAVHTRGRTLCTRGGRGRVLEIMRPHHDSSSDEEDQMITNAPHMSPPRPEADLHAHGEHGGNQSPQRPGQDQQNNGNGWDVPEFIWQRANMEQPNCHAFRGQPGIHEDTSNFSPINCFELFIGDDLLNHFTIQTNMYAAQFLASHPNLPRHSRYRSWHDTNPSEMRQFLGLLLLTGIIQKPSLHHYWSIDVLYETPIFRSIMTRNRFQNLLKFFHLNDNAQAPNPADPNRDRLYKLRPLIDHLFEKFQTIYTPQQNMSVDESLLLWKGRLLFKQYIPLKRARFGIKIFLACEDSGYTYRFKIYTGKDDPAGDRNRLLPQEVQNFRKSEKMVLHLLGPLLDQGYNVWMDNWYSSTQLYSYLHHRSTNACGTVRLNMIPREIREERVAHGEVRAYRSGPLLIIKFHDKKVVHMLTTIHTEETQRVQRQAQRQRNQDAQHKPVAVVQYNRYMGGVDKQDQISFVNIILSYCFHRK